jgi:flavin-dependent dehydrogenase
MDVLEVDVLVCGGGMSGMACAAFAAEAGARTLVIEKQGEIGGSSNLSAGMLYVSGTALALRQLADNMTMQLGTTHIRHAQILGAGRRS